MRSILAIWRGDPIEEGELPTPADVWNEDIIPDVWHDPGETKQAKNAIAEIGRDCNRIEAVVKAQALELAEVKQILLAVAAKVDSPQAVEHATPIS